MELDSLFLDLSVRFFVNLPSKEWQSFRIMFHIEQLYYYFIDHFPSLQETFKLPLPQKEYTLPYFIHRFGNWFALTFSIAFSQFGLWWEEYIERYKKEIPVAGALIFRQADKNKISFLSVQGLESQKWGLPKGKLNCEESWLEGAMREVGEETGWNGWALAHSHLSLSGKKVEEINLNPSERKERKDYSKGPCRPSSLSTRPTPTYESYFYVDLMYRAGPQVQTPIRFYILHYDYMISLLPPSQVKKLRAPFAKDKKEISEISWLNWSTIGKDRQVTWLVRQHYTLLNQAVQYVFREQNIK
jgi:hypothetical protein